MCCLHLHSARFSATLGRIYRIEHHLMGTLNRTWSGCWFPGSTASTTCCINYSSKTRPFLTKIITNLSNGNGRLSQVIYTGHVWANRESHVLCWKWNCYCFYFILFNLILIPKYQLKLWAWFTSMDCQGLFAFGYLPTAWSWATRVSLI